MVLMAIHFLDTVQVSTRSGVLQLNNKLAIGLIVGIFCQCASAAVCDYRPSRLIGGGVTSAVGGAAGATAATGLGMKAAGIYTLTHATTGAAMLGSTAAGASAAGTAGILAGTGGTIGVIGTALVSPILIIPAAVVAAGVSSLEGGCYLVEKKK